MPEFLIPSCRRDPDKIPNIILGGEGGACSEADGREVVRRWWPAAGGHPGRGPSGGGLRGAADFFLNTRINTSFPRRGAGAVKLGAPWPIIEPHPENYEPPSAGT